jgi:pimeloyl-ACP methyl ester carboxylesterase
MQTVTINGVQLAYHDEGSGAPLLLIHAFPLHSLMWKPQIVALSSRRRVIAPDLRGFGASALGEAPTSLDQYADDLVALLDQLGIERVAVCGLSMGGYIAFSMLRRHRARIGALILADTRAGADTDEARQARETNARLAEQHGAGALADQMLPKLLAPAASDSLRDDVRRIIGSNDGHGAAAALRCMAARPDSTPLLSSIDIPTLIIVGAEDALTPPSEAHAMHAAIRNSQLVEIPRVAHLSNMEAEAAFSEAIDQFLG